MVDRVDVALECSTAAPSLALGLPDGRVLERAVSARAHASELVPALAALLGEHSIPAGGVRTLFVGTGPGSYTGLRVAIATALGWARGSGAGLVGIPSPDALLFSELRAGESGAWIADARGDRAYWTRQRRTAQGLVCEEAARLLRWNEVAGRLREVERIFGRLDELSRAELDPATAARLEGAPGPRAAALLHLGRQRLSRGEVQPSASLEPLYLRPFAAVPRRR